MISCTRRVHCIGIGGVGMSAMAEIMAAMGCRVTGSDREQSYLTTRLESRGIRIQYSHAPLLIRDAEFVVYSSAVKPDNEERVFAAQHGIPQIRRAEIVGDIMRGYFSIAVAGTHGKTTTTSLIGHVFSFAGTGPTVLAGGVSRTTASNTMVGTGRTIIIEADEFDRSFLSMFPTIAVITNIEADHLDCYKDLDDIKNAFVSFANLTPFYGSVVACIDDPGVREVLPRIRGPVVTYGVDPTARYRAEPCANGGASNSFVAFRGAERLGKLDLLIPGTHNVLNALAALACSMETGIEFDSVAAAFRTFTGVKRRFEVIGEAAGVTVVDDYAHHPSEIAATLAAARGRQYKRVVAVFQPHLFTRTRDFLAGFAKALSAADMVVVTSIYQSREQPIEGVRAEAIVELLRKSGHTSAQFVSDMDTLPSLLAPQLLQGDAVVVMGAGDVWKVCSALVEELTNG